MERLSVLNNNESFLFIDKYFYTLFVKRKLEKLDDFLHSDYWDDDCGVAGINHIEESKKYLNDLFQRKPEVGVKVHSAHLHDNVITANLEWYNDISDPATLWMKGVGLFVMESGKIHKRHTFIYQKSE